MLERVWCNLWQPQFIRDPKLQYYDILHSKFFFFSRLDGYLHSLVENVHKSTLLCHAFLEEIVLHYYVTTMYRELQLSSLIFFFSRAAILSLLHCQHLA